MSESAAFRTVLRGYEPAQVDHALAELDASVQAARQEAAAKTVEVTKLHSAVAALQEQLGAHRTQIAALEEDQRKAAAPSYADLGARIGSILTLADEEAAEIRGQAEQAAATHRAEATKEADATRVAADRYAEDIRTKADAEAARVLEEAKRRADGILDDADREAVARREEAEAVFESQRAKAAAAAADFETTLATRRDKAAADFAAQMDTHEQALLAVQERASTLTADAEKTHAHATAQAAGLLDHARQEAAALVAAAREQADRVRRDSERKLAAVTAQRDSINAQLTNVRQMLATLGGPSFVDPFGAPVAGAAEVPGGPDVESAAAVEPVGEVIEELDAELMAAEAPDAEAPDAEAADPEAADDGDETGADDPADQVREIKMAVEPEVARAR